MKILDKYYNKDYSQIAFYVIKTVLEIFVLGLIIYYLAGKTGAALSFASAVLKPLILGLALTYLFSPLVAKLENKLFSSLKGPKAGRLAAVILTVIIVLAVLFFILGIIVVTITKSVSSFNLEDIKAMLLALADQFSRFWSTIEKTLAGMNINLGSTGDFLSGIFNGVKEGASTLLFACIFAIYFLIDDSIAVYWSGVLDAFTNAQERTKMKVFASDANRVFSGYIRGQSTDALIVGILVSIAMLIARIPYAVVIGILTGVGNLVPYVGPVIGFASLIIVSLAEGSISKLIIGGIILAVVMFIDSNVINPRLISSNVEVHPVLVIVALLAGGKIGGVVGMLIAVPVAALLKLQFERYVERRRKIREKQDMETKFYIVTRIDGDYAWLKRTDTDKDEEPVFIARALLPEGIDEGTKLKSEFLQYEIV